MPPLGIGDAGSPGNAGLRVLGVPAFRNRELNPYNALLYEAVARAGVSVDEMTPRRLVGRRYDIVHLHWPEYLFSAPGYARAMLQAVLFIVAISWLGRRHSRVVWTVHNLQAHEGSHARLERCLWTWFVNRVDGYIALTEGGREAVLERFPVLARRPGFVIPHGHFRDVYPDMVDRIAARRALGLPIDANVLCFLGAIRPYKNVPSLITAFRDVRDATWRLVIAGEVPDDGVRADLVERVRGDARIHLNPRFVPAERVQFYMRAADLAVLPYSDILNSGSAMLALSFGLPVLVPALGAMNELRDQVGDDWVQTFEGPLSPVTLRNATHWAKRDRYPSHPSLGDHEWEEIARRTVAAFEAVLDQSAMSPIQTADSRGG